MGISDFSPENDVFFVVFFFFFFLFFVFFFVVVFFVVFLFCFLFVCFFRISEIFYFIQTNDLPQTQSCKFHFLMGKKKHRNGQKNRSTLKEAKISSMIPHRP